MSIFRTQIRWYESLFNGIVKTSNLHVIPYTSNRVMVQTRVFLFLSSVLTPEISKQVVRK